MRIVWTLALLLAAVAASGHVGSPIAVWEGAAGAYPVRVVVRLPDVLPGQADVSVRVAGAERVTVQPVFWKTGTKGAPVPDPAKPVAGEPGLYSVPVWFMTSGSYSVAVAVEGPRGKGAVMVPVGPVSTNIPSMQAGLGWILAGLGILLFAGMVTLVSAATRESVLPPGTAPDARARRRGRVAGAWTCALLVLALTGGRHWWQIEDAGYKRRVQRPMKVATSAGGGVFTLAVKDTTWLRKKVSPLVPDHGKLMHLFLVRQPQMDAFAHLHPVRVDSATFRSALPPLPAGSYRVYADVVHETGFARTLVDTVAVPAGGAGAGLDADDSWLAAPGARPAAPGGSARLADGSTLTWQAGAPLVAGRDATLSFVLRDARGRPAALEPYMGMAGHAVVNAPDGSVFVHLHPAGTVASSAQTVFARRESGDTLDAADGRRWSEALDAPASHAGHAPAGATGQVRFPYAFPRAGSFRVWVQVKSGGKVHTGSFDATVAEAG